MIQTRQPHNLSSRWQRQGGDVLRADRDGRRRRRPHPPWSASPCFFTSIPHSNMDVRTARDTRVLNLGCSRLWPHQSLTPLAPTTLCAAVSQSNLCADRDGRRRRRPHPPWSARPYFFGRKALIDTVQGSGSADVDANPGPLLSQVGTT